MVGVLSSRKSFFFFFHSCSNRSFFFPHTLFVQLIVLVYIHSYGSCVVYFGGSCEYLEMLVLSFSCSFSFFFFFSSSFINRCMDIRIQWRMVMQQEEKITRAFNKRLHVCISSMVLHLSST
ncbi:hypothetical protein P175DRAFT_0372111 [Aspergillus ochraceoroseus IBT 24754]|uniref:Uncharacterized protein n=1 Tax=Aspergillus ochraceoroseus IBT 24754 TaxID=1392256 RepID=A0A2T5LN11_9EURO|nr:uncharacterized protein P175DRAFT_0372111 [Aspergillus ochraceoroseus IBT 24754]PTU17668.1 hypothetical protein P175DRAFT_0372111 [Aspergillus ochraceoroseus IBT 24754]